MSQQTALFQQALAAKLAGNEEGFKAAVREAIIAKTKAILGESSRYKGPGVEEVDTGWFFVDRPFSLPEGNPAGVPAGQYTASFHISGISYGGSLEFEEAQIHPVDDDAILASLDAGPAEQIFSTLPQQVQDWVSSSVESSQSDRGEAAEFDRQQDMAADRAWDRQTNMDGKDYPF